MLTCNIVYIWSIYSIENLGFSLKEKFKDYVTWFDNFILRKNLSEK
jgi:hypothetical protein